MKSTPVKDLVAGLAHKARGRANQRRGASLESRIAADLTAAGAWVVAVPPPVRLLGLAPAPKTGRHDPRIHLARLESPTAPDWLGVTPQGRALALEGKTALAEAHPVSYPLGKRLRGHQGAALSAVGERGGVAAVLLWRDLGAIGSLYLLPWPVCDPRPERVSWAWGEIEPWRVPHRVAWTGALADWEGYCQRGWEVDR